MWTVDCGLPVCSGLIHDTFSPDKIPSALKQHCDKVKADYKEQEKASLAKQQGGTASLHCSPLPPSATGTRLRRDSRFSGPPTRLAERQDARRRTPASFPSLYARSGLTPRRRPALFAALDGSLRPPRPPSEPEFLSSLKLSAERKNFPEPV